MKNHDPLLWGGVSGNFCRKSFAKKSGCSKIEYCVQKLYSFHKSEFFCLAFSVCKMV